MKCNLCLSENKIKKFKLFATTKTGRAANLMAGGSLKFKICKECAYEIHDGFYRTTGRRVNVGEDIFEMDTQERAYMSLSTEEKKKIIKSNIKKHNGS